MDKLGKGLFIWKVKNLYKGDHTQIDPQNILDRANKMGLQWLNIKIANERYKYNLRPPDWTDDILPPLVKTLKDGGLKVWGWHYVYGDTPEKEANVAIERVEELGLDGYAIDAEGHYKGKPTSAKIFMSIISKHISVPIALTSYRYPSYHPELPWEEFLKGGVDVHMPQVYWRQPSEGTPVEQWERSRNELRAIADLPFVPAGPTFAEGGWEPRKQEVIDFNDKVVEEDRHGILFWSWDSIVEGTSRPWKEVVTNLEGWEEPEPPLPPIPPGEHDNYLKGYIAGLKKGKHLIDEELKMFSLRGFD